MQDAIGKELKVLRLRKDLKPEQVARDLEINVETLRRYENASTGMSIERLEELLNYYNADKLIFFESVCAYNHKQE